MPEKLFDSELKVMDVLWKKGDMPAKQISDIPQTMRLLSGAGFGHCAGGRRDDGLCRVCRWPSKPGWVRNGFLHCFPVRSR